MLEILKALKKIIERFIADMVSLRETANPGDTTIYVQNTRRFMPGDYIVIRKSVDSSEAELLCVKNVIDRNTLLAESPNGDPITQKYETPDALIQKLIGYQAGETDFLKAVYIGDPSVISHFPAITIDAKSKNNSWLTLESISEEYEIDITVYVDGQAYYESQYELMHFYTKQIERSLFRSLYPLVQPYNITTLSEDVSPGDNIIRVTDEDFFKCGLGWIFFESVDSLVINRAEESLGNGALRLVRPVGANFATGDNVIHPLRHIYNSMPHTIQYGITNKGSGILRAARISYKCNEEKRLYSPFIDPLTF